MVPPHSYGIPRVPHYSGFRLSCSCFSYRIFTFFDPASQTGSDHIYSTYVGPYPLLISKLGLGSFPFARRYSENRFFFLFLQVLRCFSSLRSPPYLMCSDTDDICFHISDFSIRTSMDQCLQATPHSLSQLTTSFIGSKCQGILRVHFLA